MDPQQAVRAPDQDNYDPKTKVGNALTVTQAGERTICEIKRHPIGMLGVYVSTGLMLIVVAVLAFIVAPHYIAGGAALAIGAVVFVLVAAFSLIFAFISNKVYWGNSWVVTTDSLTQIEQDSLFSRQSSQLSLGNLEDITADQNGILPHMFNYGFIKAETAGERSKFVFPYCPNPNYYAQQILSARENFEQRRSADPGDNQQRTYRSEGSYAPPDGQAGDPGYGAVPPPAPASPPAPPTNEEPQSEGLSPTDYPDSSDQGVNTNT